MTVERAYRIERAGHQPVQLLWNGGPVPLSPSARCEWYVPVPSSSPSVVDAHRQEQAEYLADDYIPEEAFAAADAEAYVPEEELLLTSAEEYIPEEVTMTMMAEEYIPEDDMQFSGGESAEPFVPSDDMDSGYPASSLETPEGTRGRHAVRIPEQREASPVNHLDIITRVLEQNAAQIRQSVQAVEERVETAQREVERAAAENRVIYVKDRDGCLIPVIIGANGPQLLSSFHGRGGGAPIDLGASIGALSAHDSSDPETGQPAESTVAQQKLLESLASGAVVDIEEFASFGGSFAAIATAVNLEGCGAGCSHGHGSEGGGSFAGRGGTLFSKEGVHIEFVCRSCASRGHAHSREVKCGCGSKDIIVCPNKKTAKKVSAALKDAMRKQQLAQEQQARLARAQQQHAAMALAA